jgi:AbrB family looped-hinge helix DNA binding protein
MTEVTRISTKGQVVIPSSIREALGLGNGDPLLIERVDQYVVMRKYSVPNLMKEFKQLTAFGKVHAKKKGIRNEDDVVRMIHQSRGVKHA